MYLFNKNKGYGTPKHIEAIKGSLTKMKLTYHDDKERVSQVTDHLSGLLGNKALSPHVRGLINDFAHEVSAKIKEGSRFIPHKWLNRYKDILKASNIKPSA